MKTFDELYHELEQKVAVLDVAESRTAREFQAGTHEIGKKIVEEAAEVWMAAEHEGKARAAEEISQLLYHIQVMMLANNITLQDVYEVL